ncbi:hypothetical protein [Streptomyces sp. NPDC005096]|uniref:hypothetical protein n=1 Tax=Streptomyces sp. NPDC005096 TaxID=3154559 RepID=UPI0033B242B2
MRGPVVQIGQDPAEGAYDIRSVSAGGEVQGVGPADAVKLTRSQLRALVKRADRPRRGIEAEVERLRDIYRADCLH